MKRGEKIPAFKLKSREAARAIIANQELEDSYSALLGLPEDQSEWDEHEQEVSLVSNMRLEAARRQAEVQARIDELPKGSAELKELREVRREINREINEMPAAGSTFTEWEELSEEERSTGPGRPPVPIEVKLVQSRIDRENAINELREVEKEEGRSKSTIKQILKYYEKATAKTGRDPIDPLGALDRQIRKIDADIEKVESGDAEEEYQRRLEQAMVSSAGKRYGRPPEPPAKRAERLKARRSDLVKRLKAMEQSLSPIEKMERMIKVKRDDLFYLRKDLRDRGIDPKEEDISGQPEAGKINALLQEIEEIKGYIAKMSKGGDDAKFMEQVRARELEKANKKFGAKTAAKRKVGNEDLDALASNLGVG